MNLPVPLAVASDVSQSVAYNEQRLINLYPESSPLGGKTPFILIGTPALKPYSSAGHGPLRGAIKMADIPYFVSDNTLLRLNADLTSTACGTSIISGDGLVSMATAGTQIAIATSGDEGFIYDSSTGVLAKIVDVDFFGGGSVTSLDGYFVWESSNVLYTNRFQISGLFDGMSYDALDFAAANSTATTLKRVFLVGTQLFMMKSDRIEVWYDSGNADFPIEKLNSTIIPKGLAGKFSPALADNTVFWIGYDDEGGGSPSVFRANGYTATVVSTHAVARALSEVGNLDLIQGISYVKDNHTFYGMLLPSGNAWFYDVGAGVWHERATYGYDRWLGSVHVDAYGKTLIGSYVDGSIFELDLDTYLDNTDVPILREATLPPFGTDPQLKCCSCLRLDMETGVGLIDGQGSDALIILNVSDDRGKTWSSDMAMSIGPMGQYGYGVEWRQMGQFRSRVHKLRISDPVKVALLALYADIN